MPETSLDAPGVGGAVARGGALRVGAYAAGQAMAVAAAALLFRHLGVVDAGRYVTALSLAAIVQGLADVGLSTLATRQIAVADPARRRAMMARVMGLRLALASAGVGAALLFAVAVGYPSSMVAGVALAGAGLVAMTLQGTLAVAGLVRLRVAVVALAEVARQATGLVCVALLVAAGAGLVPFFAALIPAGLVALGVTAVGLRGEVGLRLSAHGWGPLARDVLPFAVAAAAGVLFFRVTVVEMSLLATDHETGLFAASFRVVEVLAALPPLAVGTAFPVLAARAMRDGRRGLDSAVARSLQAAAALGVGIALVLALGGAWIVRLVAGPDFAAAGDVLRLQGAALAASFVAAPWAYALLALHRERALALVNAVGVALAVGVAAALIEAFGAEGAAGATVAGEAGLALAFGVLLAREGVAVGLRGLVPVVVAGGLGGAAALLPVGGVAQTLIGAAVYVAALGALAVGRR